MPPYQNQFPAPPPQQPEQNPYEFFMEPQNSGKKGLLPGNGSPMTKVLLIAGAAILGLFIIGIIIVMMAGGKGDSAPLLSVAQTQTEIIRVAGEGAKVTKTSRLQNFAVTTQVTVSSAQRELLALMSKQGIKTDDKQLALGKKAKTDTALAAARAANTYDITFASTMETELDGYMAKLKEASAKATTRAERALLEKQLAGAKLLNQQLLAE